MDSEISLSDPLDELESSDEWEREQGENTSETDDESEGDEEVDGGRQRNHSSEFPTAGTSENRENAHPRTRKRQKHESKAQKRKRARNSGLPYVSSRGKEVAVVQVTLVSA
ncbi:uncharacterized protein [Anabrus simplex]|uniref:uncharacterized protein n=1 Tax=Anabrus simplex TaxID=316456 RepID=UPI0035A2935B